MDHGKSTLTDSLVLKAGFMSASKVGVSRVTDTRDDEKDRGITIKSTAISMYFEVNKEDMNAIKEPSKGNLIVCVLILTWFDMFFQGPNS